MRLTTTFYNTTSISPLGNWLPNEARIEKLAWKPRKPATRKTTQENYTSLAPGGSMGPH